MSARQQPFLLGTIGAVIGIVLAVIVFGGFGGGSASASASPTSAAVASGGASPSPSLAPAETTGASTEVTAPPITAAPTLVATLAPTAAPTAKPSATPNTNPRIVSFDVPSQEDCTNSTAGSVHLKWSIKNATGVTISIDGPGIFDTYPGLSREVDLPYGCSDVVLQHTYTITTVGGTGPVASITKTIKTRAPSIVSFTVSKPDCQPGDTSVGVSVTYEIRAATGAALYRDGELQANYNGKEVTVMTPYDCSQNDQVFKLTTTGGYGPAASKSVTVSKN